MNMILRRLRAPDSDSAGVPPQAGFARREARALPRAFTLIELLAVLAIIGILAAIAVPTLGAFKPNVTAAATRQLLDDLARARQLAISQRTTVYMVFVPTNFWADPNYSPALTAADLRVSSNLFGKQLTGYTLVSLRTLGDQPGQSSPRYLSTWRVLPEGAFIPPEKFSGGLVITTNDSGNNAVLAYTILPFPRTNGVPFPSETAPGIVNANLMNWATLPYLGFNYLGQLISQRDEVIPLAKGSVGVARDANKQPTAVESTFTQTPAGNATNSFNVVKVEWLTGRAHVERLEVR